MAPSRVSTPSAGIAEISFSRSAASRAAAQAGPLPNTTAVDASTGPTSSTHERARASDASTASGTCRRAASSAASAVTSAQTASAATTLPQNAWVCVTARWFATVTSARAPAREPSVEPAVEVTAA